MSSRRRCRSTPSDEAEATFGDQSRASDDGGASKRHHGVGAGLDLSAVRTGDAPALHVDDSEHGNASDPAAGEEMAATGGHEEHVQEVPPTGTIAPQPVLIVPVVA